MTLYAPNRFWFAAVTAWAISCWTGCSSSGPELGTVSGTVTLDGQPLPDATVTFMPETGRSSSGRTDPEGKYELNYTFDRAGAVVGKHIVRITTAGKSGAESPDPSDEKLPARYHANTELKAAVERGHNEVDFDLTSQGPRAPAQPAGGTSGPRS